MEAAQNHERHKKNGQNPIHRLNGKTIYIYTVKAKMYAVHQRRRKTQKFPPQARKDQERMKVVQEEC